MHNKEGEKKPIKFIARIGGGLLAIVGGTIMFWYMCSYIMILSGFDSWPINQQSILYRTIALGIDFLGIGIIGFCFLLWYLGIQMIQNRAMNGTQVDYCIRWIVVGMLIVGSLLWKRDSKLVGSLVYLLIWVLEKNPLFVILVLLISSLLTEKWSFLLYDREATQPTTSSKEASPTPPTEEVTPKKKFVDVAEIETRKEGEPLLVNHKDIVRMNKKAGLEAGYELAFSLRYR